MNYQQASKMVYDVAHMVRIATGLPVDFNENSTNGLFQSGAYMDALDRFVIGSKSLATGKKSDSVPYVDCLSMCKQQLREYRHWQQRQMFRGLSYDPAKYGFPVLSFGDNATCRTMARQKMISAEFPSYQRENQFVLSYECDAEEYAVYSTQAILEHVGFPKELIEPCLLKEINRRNDWYGDRPVESSLKAVKDLREKKCGSCLAKLPLEYAIDNMHAVAKSFLSDVKSQAAYEALDPKSGDAYLIDYIGRRDPRIFCMYDIIRDDMPELSPIEKLRQMTYRCTHDVPDNNNYDSPDF